ncbi:subtilisin-like protease-like protein [Trifolium pratense]|uniref:Subtilisin-like protease-like protein n=1 Tax=Trifolium pratense TaxID=57577 RepID=A0A2K3N7H7_TRIPR|nr:subtilisin-like protease-like protein [Trifolium pratense]
MIAIGAFHAVERGIIVVCAAGNYGPEKSTIVNDAPWILTVAATTIDCDLQSNVVMGTNKVIKGRAINFSPLSKSADYPMIYGEAAKTTTADSDEASERKYCRFVCVDGINDDLSIGVIITIVQALGGLGLVRITDQIGAEAEYYGDFPATVVRTKHAATILQYINSTSNPVATILPTSIVIDYKPAPIVATFSSRGPSSLSKNILKPDVAAPGVNILTAWIGLAASIKSENPTWSPSAIRSAITTSATQFNNMKAPITRDLGSVATPYDYGAGGITTIQPFQPGLVYETTTLDYFNYLCYIGLNSQKVAKQ